METERKARRLAALLFACGIAGGATAAGTTPVKLTAQVGPGSTITLKKGNLRVTTLKAGAYQISVRDRSSSHNFRLRGTGVNRATSVAAVTTQTWNVTLRPGNYSFLCDPHRTFMKGSFQVTR